MVLSEDHLVARRFGGEQHSEAVARKLVHLWPQVRLSHVFDRQRMEPEAVQQKVVVAVLRPLDVQPEAICVGCSDQSQDLFHRRLAVLPAGRDNRPHERRLVSHARYHRDSATRYGLRRGPRWGDEADSDQNHGGGSEHVGGCAHHAAVVGRTARRSLEAIIGTPPGSPSRVVLASQLIHASTY